MLGHRFRHRITIEKPVKTQDAVTGEMSVSWEVVRAHEPADVMTGPGRERVISNAMQSDTKAKITVRWFADLDQKMRIKWDGNTYNIKSFEVDRTARRFYYIECGDEGVNEG